MNKKLLFSTALVLVFTVGVFGWKAYKRSTAVRCSLQLVGENNVEALSGTDSEPSWWDFFNNYIVEERIPINTYTCKHGVVTYKGKTFQVSSCTRYSMAIYWHCYDGGRKDQCTSSGVHEYI